jgi:predicted CXXCH cytochrome family protein
MRVRTAKKLAERIDLHYFKRAHGMRRWRILLSVGIPALAVLWIAGLAAAGSRRAYSAGPVSSAHAFAETRCEVCHTRASSSFRAHVSEKACLTCHDAPAHASNQTPPPGCSTCHAEHRGRVPLAKVDAGFCVGCHGDLTTAHGAPSVAARVGRFPSAHPEFAAAREGAKDPGTIKFNHAVHVKKDGVRSPTGVEVLQCADCHPPSPLRGFGAAGGPRTWDLRPRTSGLGLMSRANYAQNCARCHGLEFDYRIDRPAPHDTPEIVRAAVRTALQNYIAAHPQEIGRPDDPRRLPLNFPQAPEPPARNAAEWVARRADNAERLLWSRCTVCHARTGTVTLTVPEAQPVADSRRTVSVPVSVPAFAASNITTRWMTRAAFDHVPHLMVQCVECHAAETSQLTADVLMPDRATCATCHAPSRGAEARCFECHQYHDWSKAHAVSPAFKLTDFK